MKVLKFLDDHLEEMICVAVLAAMTLVIFIQIIIRLISPPYQAAYGMVGRNRPLPFYLCGIHRCCLRHA